MLQAGYPEEAEPIVTSLFQQVAAGSAPRELSSALYLLRGEISRRGGRRRTSRKPRNDFEKSLAAGPESAVRPFWFGWRRSTSSSAEFEQAIARIDSLDKQGQGQPERSSSLRS